ncbi:MAG: hypothetical protein WB760_07550 [Xanthobacteraceae bacterium]
MRIGVIKILGAALALTVMVASAQAQLGGSPGGGGRQHFDKRNQKSSEPTKPKADDKAYNSALKSLPDKQYDPWHGMH